MNADQGVAFLKALGVKKIRVKDNGWVEGCCPLAPWTHEHQSDHTPSFGISISPGERSYYSCFACNRGSVEELLQTLELYAKEKKDQFDFAQARQLLDTELEVLPLPEYGSKTEHAEVFVEWPQYWINSFQLVEWNDAASNYLHHRNVDINLAKGFNLRYDTKREMIVAPYSDVFNRFAGARGRSIRNDVEGQKKHYDYSFQNHNNCRLVWYNEGALNLKGPVVIVEGQFDCWRTVQAHRKTLAALTAKPTFEKMKKLGDCPFVIQIPDRDMAGQQSTELYAKMCQQLGIGYKTLWLDEGVKDPDECAVEYLRDRIEALL